MSQIITNSGITYHRLVAPADWGDNTVNRSLYGYEVDRNFYNLKSKEIKSLEFEDDTIYINRVNGDMLSAKISHPIVPKNDPEPGFVLTYVSGETEETSGYYWQKPDFGADRYYLTFWDTLDEPHVYEKNRSSLVVGHKIGEYLPDDEPEHYGYTFNGWKLSATTEAFNPNIKIVDDMDYEPDYLKNQYKAIFKNVGNVVGLTGETVSGKTFLIEPYIPDTEGIVLSSVTVNGELVKEIDDKYEYTPSNSGFDLVCTYQIQTSGKYRLLTSIDSIADDTDIILTNESGITSAAHTLSQTISSSRFTACTSSIILGDDDNRYLEPNTGAMIFNFIKIDGSDKYYIKKKGSDSYLYLNKDANAICCDSGYETYPNSNKWAVSINSSNGRISIHTTIGTAERYLRCNTGSSYVFAAYKTTSQGMLDTYPWTLQLEPSYKNNIGTQAFSGIFDYNDTFTIEDKNDTRIGWSDDLTNSDKVRTVTITGNTLYKPIQTNSFSITFKNQSMIGKNDYDIELTVITPGNGYDTILHSSQVLFDEKCPAYNTAYSKYDYDDKTWGWTTLFETKNEFTDISAVTLYYSTNKNETRGDAEMMLEILSGDNVSIKQYYITASGDQTPLECKFNLTEEITDPKDLPDGKIRISLRMKNYSFFLGRSDGYSMQISARDIIL